MSLSPERRFSARRVNLWDRNLSVYERLVYQLLDDMCGPKGSCFPSYETIAAICCMSRRNVAYALSALKKAGYLTSRKRQHTSAEFTLVWAIPGVQSAALLEREKCTPMHFSDVEFCTSEPPHLLMNQSDLTKNINGEDVDRVLGWLREYPGALHAIGCEPPLAIAQQCIAAVDGDLDLLGELLLWLHKRQGAKPGRSWGWFPVVLGNAMKQRRTA